MISYPIRIAIPSYEGKGFKKRRIIIIYLLFCPQEGKAAYPLCCVFVGGVTSSTYSILFPSLVIGRIFVLPISMKGLVNLFHREGEGTGNKIDIYILYIIYHSSSCCFIQFLWTICCSYINRERDILVNQ